MPSIPAVKEKIEGIGTSPMVMNADEFGALIRCDIAMHAKVIKAAKLEVD